MSSTSAPSPGRAADDALLRELHREHADSLWRYVMGLTGGDRGRAEDVVQETMLRAWRNPSMLSRSAGPARAWLFTVAKRIVIDEWRSARVRSEITAAEVPERPSHDETDRVLETWLVADAMRALSDDHRDVIVECYYRGRSIAEAAARLGIAEGTVKSRCHYAVRALSVALAERGVSA